MLLDINYISRMADEIRALAGDDEQCFLDTLEGETDAFEIIDQALQEDREARAMAAAIKQMIADLRVREARMQRRSEAARRVMRDVLKAMGVRKLERPGGTVSLRKPTTKVEIVSPGDVPTQLCKVVKQPDKAAIKAALMQGEVVPGAELVVGDESVSVRVA